MNIWDALIAAAVAALVIWAVRRVRKQKGGCGCGCGCEGCTGCPGGREEKRSIHR